MNQFCKKITTPVFFIVIILMIQFSYSQDIVKNETWKKELQVLLDFRGEKVDGIMGIETFNALKKFAISHDLTDVVLRGQFEDIGFWGFEQYLIKYQTYWVREIKNQRIIDDVQNKEYIRQADETLYSFEIAIQNAQLEVERLLRAKAEAKRLAREKQELQKWDLEKKEAERLTTELQRAILKAEVEADKWSLERLMAKRLAAEKEQLDRLNARKAEAIRLTNELEEIISSAKSEIDRLIDENKKMKKIIKDTEKTETMAEELIVQLSVTQNELTEAQGQIQVLSVRNDTLDKKLQDTKVEIENMLKSAKNPWWKFWTKKALTNIDSLGTDTTRWYHHYGLNIHNNNLILYNVDEDKESTEIVPTIAFDIRYHLPLKTMYWDIILEYSPSFTYSNNTPLLEIAIQNQFSIKRNFGISLKFGVANLSSFEPQNYISFKPEINYTLPLSYKFISTTYFLSPQIMSPLDGSDKSVFVYLNTGLRITID